MRRSGRSSTIILRVSAARRSLIDQASEVLGKTRTEFLLDAAVEKAKRVLIDRTVFALDAAPFQRFEKLLEAPVDRAAINKLLKRRAPWERELR